MNIRRWILLLFTWITVFAGSCPAYASTSDMTVQQVQIVAAYEEAGIPDLSFSLYKVGIVDEEGKISLSEKYRAYPIVTAPASAEAWQSTAFTLAGYLQADQVPPDGTGITGADGTVSLDLSGNEDAASLYLLLGDSHSSGKLLYTVAPAFFTDQDADQGVITIHAKVSVKETTDQALTVHKVWKNITDPDQKPDHIDVKLLRDGKAVETVTLSENNSWTYEWKNLDGSSVWSCSEVKVSGFVTTVTQENQVITITNTRPKTTTYTEKIPQTGDLTWPYYLLFTIGMLNLLAGLVFFEKRGALPMQILGVVFVFAAVIGTLQLQHRNAEFTQKKDQELVLLQAEINDNITELAADAADGADANGYIGTIEVPELGILMPVTENWDYDKLKKAACCYYGGPEDSSMVIAGHSYADFFRPLRNAKEGQRVIFTDLYGNRTEYQVAAVETLKPNEIERMISSEYELTLFTCTRGGKARCTVRCSRLR